MQPTDENLATENQALQAILDQAAQFDRASYDAMLECVEAADRAAQPMRSISAYTSTATTAANPYAK